MTDQNPQLPKSGSPIPPPPAAPAPPQAPPVTPTPVAPQAQRPPVPPVPPRPQGAGAGPATAYPTPGQQWGPQQVQQPSHQHTQQFPSQGFPVGAGAGLPPQPPHSTPAPAPVAEPGFFRALFDLNFEHFVVLKFAKFIYVLGMVLNVLTWLGGALFLFLIGATVSRFDGGEMFILFGVLTLVFGWIGVILNTIILRVIIELVIAQVRTAQNTTKLASR